MRKLTYFCLALALSAIPASAFAATVDVLIEIENLAPTNSVTFAPLRIGFNSGVYDSFDNNAPATAAIISIAEGGSGSDWFPAFQAADPTATLGTVVSDPPGPLLPGATASAVFTVDTDVNPFFTFGSMVVPSNDYFIGNDSPTAHQLFDGAGNLIVNSITQTASDIWDSGSEVDGTFGAAFLMGSMNDDRIPDNENVHFDFSDLSLFNGSTTAAGYTFDSQLTAGTEVYQISFSIVPEPTTVAMIAIAGCAMLRRKRRAASI